MTNNIPRLVPATAGNLERTIRRCLFGLTAACAVTSACVAAPVAQPQLVADYGKVPLSFEANHNNEDSRFQYLARGAGYGVFLSPGEAVLALKRAAGPHAPATTATLRMALRGSNPAAATLAEQPLPGTVNYLYGNDARRWATGIRTYQKVRFSDVYPGVDVVYYGNQGRLEYDFVVAAGANPGAIALHFTGAKAALDANGDLLLADGAGESRFHRPVIYQWDSGAKHVVAGAYRLNGQDVRFTVGNYDHRRPLVIDPVLTYQTVLGGSLDDRGFAIAADAAGNAYVAGDTVSTNFPLMNPYQSTNHNTSNGWVVFVSKLNPAGTALVYSTFIGGALDSHALGLAVDGSGNAYVGGYTSAQDFPVTAGAFQTVCGGQHDSQGNRVGTGCVPGGDVSGFVTKLNAAGNGLVYSTYLSGDNYNQVSAVAVNGAGEAYVGGSTNAYCGLGPYANNAYLPFQCFPTTSGALQSGTMVPGGGGVTNYGFFAKFNAAGSALVYSTLYGPANGSNGTGNSLSDSVLAVAVDGAGNGYIAGSAGYGIPTSSGAYYVPPANSSNVLPPYPAFVAKFNPTLSGSASLVYGTFLGSAAQTALATNYSNVATGLAADAAGNAYVGGYAATCGYPVTAGAYQTANIGTTTGCTGGFVTKVAPDGKSLVWSTLLGSQPGGANNTVLNGLARGANGNIYVTGTVQGGDYPQVNPVHPLGGAGGAVISVLDPQGAKLLFSTYVSDTTGADYGVGVAADPAGNVYATGRTSHTIPTTTGALQTVYNGGSYDAYVVKVSLTAPTTTTLVVAPVSATEGQAVTLTATVAGASGGSTPTGTVNFLNGTTTLATANVNATGVATATSSTLAIGTYSVTAAYLGDGSDDPSTSTAQSLTVIAKVAAPVVTLSASPTTVTLGKATALAWSSTNATSCSATGSWSGAEPSSGTASETPAAAGTSTYTLTCTGSGGTGNASAVVTVNAAAASSSGGGGHGGGGAFDWFSIVGLLGLAAMRRLRSGA